MGTYFIVIISFFLFLASLSLFFVFTLESILLCTPTNCCHSFVSRDIGKDYKNFSIRIREIERESDDDDNNDPVLANVIVIILIE